MKEALFYTKENSAVICHLCRRECKIPKGSTGFCRVRKNIDGKLYSLSYGKVIAHHIDPIEKKPLYHFHPGSHTFSFSSAGCNFACKFCQNWEISQKWNEFPQTEMSPEQIVSLAKNTDGISYTYTEPTVFYEFAKDIGTLAKKEGLYNIFVSNGYMEKQVIEDMSTFLDGINVDLKGDKKLYTELCGGIVQEFVLENIESIYKEGIHLELTTLIIPDWNDTEKTVRELAEFILSIDENIPWHLSAFYPHYKMSDCPPTSPKKLLKLRWFAKKLGINYVYLGNIGPNEFSHTYCHNCGELLIKRDYHVTVYLVNGKCPSCGTKIPGVFSGDNK